MGAIDMMKVLIGNGLFTLRLECAALMKLMGQLDDSGEQMKAL